MKRSAFIASITAGVILLGGGGWAATTLATNDEGSTTSAPVETSEPTPTPTVEPTPTAEPTPEYTEDESAFIYGARQKANVDGIEISDADLLAAGYEFCEEWAGDNNLDDIATIDGLGTVMQGDVNATALDYLCPVK